MVTSTQRRAAALEAIRRVLEGSLADSVENELVDFKTEEGRLIGGGRVRDIGPRHDPAALPLARGAACFANTETGGTLVVGVNDRGAGADALVGACSDPAWLRARIHALSQPPLTVDIEEVVESGRRLLLIEVLPALEEVRVEGRLRHRFGKECVESSGDDARRLLEARRRYDWSAEPSGMRLSDAVPEAIASAAGHLARRTGASSLRARDLAARINVLVDDSADPELTNAGAVLLCRFEPDREQLDLRLTLAEGSASFDRVHGPAPIMALYDRVLAALDARVFPRSTVLIGNENQEVRDLPEPAFREAIVNAIMHRDHRADREPIVIHAIGRPADVLKVRSPGGLVPGVSADRLIAVQSRPRNPALAEAMRVLGLAEREGVGIDTMYRVMLRDGHPGPSISVVDGGVEVRLPGGRPDLRVREVFDELARKDSRLGEDVRATIAIDLLLGRPVIRPEALAEAAQSSDEDAFAALVRLTRVGAVERTLDGSRSFRLTPALRGRLAHRLRYRTVTAFEGQSARIEALLDLLPEIARADVVARLGIKEASASRLLAAMVAAGRLEPASDRVRRGPGMRYRRPRR